ncbi:MAG: hypothetical protein MUE81_15495 [Thermoflexibacter sp.]|jgi:hypothetical protein|nr:hypothetical protein [Thermoflexibacter sp.]
MNHQKEQIEVCNRYRTIFLESPENSILGISENVKEGILPINGIRYPEENGTCGWYIWAGEELPDSPDFFVPLHVKHLEDWCPLIIKYLGLPAGYRFLVTPDYEDVWEDEEILKE